MKKRYEKTLPALRTSTEIFDNIVRAVEKYNKNSLVKISETDFRLYSYELLSQEILQDRLKDFNIRFE